MPPHDAAEGEAAWVLSGAERMFADTTLLRRFADWSLTLQDFGRDGVDADLWSRARAHAATMPLPQFPLSGADLAASGIAPGPQMGALLNALRLWWRQGG